VPPQRSWISSAAIDTAVSSGVRVGRYPWDGRPGISPAQLATVSVLQFLLNLSDRDAAEAVRCRIDFIASPGRGSGGALAPGRRPEPPVT
jgi:hypothetical protein